MCRPLVICCSYATGDRYSQIRTPGRIKSAPSSGHLGRHHDSLGEQYLAVRASSPYGLGGVKESDGCLLTGR